MKGEHGVRPMAGRFGWLAVGLVVVWAALIEWALDGGQHGLHDDPIAWIDLILLPLAVVAIVEHALGLARDLLGRVFGRLLQLAATLVVLWGSLLITLSRVGTGSTEDGITMSGFWTVAAPIAALVLVVLSGLLGWATVDRTPSRGRRETRVS